VRSIAGTRLSRWRDESAANRRLGARLALAALAASLLAVPFALLLLLVKSESGTLARLDVGTAERLHELARGSPGLVDFLDVVAIVTDPWLLRLLVLAAVIWLWRRGAHRLAAWAVTTTVLGGLLSGALKLLVLRARPSFDEPVAQAQGYSFPSGHALNSVLISGVLILVFLPVLSPRGRRLAGVTAAFVVLLTGFDRIALGVHFVSDVLAGWFVAAACLAATSAGFEIWRREEGMRPSAVSQGVDPEARVEMTAEIGEEND
jgi:undecaprenyl-diphosphatase